MQNLKSLALAVAEILHGVQTSQGRFFIGRVGLAMVSQCTKFDVSRFIHYEAMNGVAKCRKWAGLGRLGGTQGHGQCHYSIERIRLPIQL